MLRLTLIATVMPVIAAAHEGQIAHHHPHGLPAVWAAGLAVLAAGVAAGVLYLLRNRR
jgi:hypothetical protein